MQRALHLLHNSIPEKFIFFIYPDAFEAGCDQLDVIFSFGISIGMKPCSIR